MTAIIVLAACSLLTIWRLMQSAAPAMQAMSDLAATALAGAGSMSEVTWDSGLKSFLPWMVLAWPYGVLLLSLYTWKQWREWKASSEFGLSWAATYLPARILETSGVQALASGW